MAMCSWDGPLPISRGWLVGGPPVAAVPRARGSVRCGGVIRFSQQTPLESCICFHIPSAATLILLLLIQSRTQSPWHFLKKERRILSYHKSISCPLATPELPSGSGLQAPRAALPGAGLAGLPRGDLPFIDATWPSVLSLWFLLPDTPIPLPCTYSILSLVDEMERAKILKLDLSLHSYSALFEVSAFGACDSM